MRFVCVYSLKRQVLKIGLTAVIIYGVRCRLRCRCAVASYSVECAQGCMYAEGLEKLKQYGAGTSRPSSIAYLWLGTGNA